MMMMINIPLNGYELNTGKTFAQAVEWSPAKLNRVIRDIDKRGSVDRHHVAFDHVLPT